ncbi:choline/ethanolamine kinase-like [Oppia nitens]|uniref:choline/ethanolamine kinase-like n=1 Tax=Oppia nitens TaxID=1686743 RepID=UPI0023DA51E8|nr:choline/ethanolamine kinase-like [Oppia nitens]
METKKVLKNIEDFTSIEEIDFDKMDLYKGETPVDINDQCLQLCKDYLSGEWIQQTVDTITVRRVTGGLMNQLYYCGINEPNLTSKVPQEVAIKLYGEKPIKTTDNKYDRLNDTIIDLMVSVNQLGPKVYALFEHGQIQHYYKHRQFKPVEQSNKKLVNEVFRKFSRIHAMDVPIKRTHNMFMKEAEVSYKYLFNDNDINIKERFEKYNCETLLTADLKSEYEWIKQIVSKVNSPLIFTHNDFRSSNLLITESMDKTDGPIVVCDFEFSSYGYRGMDFQSIIMEWSRKQFDFSTDGLPHDDSILRPLIEIYVDECQQIHGKEFSANSVNTVDHIIYEIKIFTLIRYFFGTIIALKKDLEDNSNTKYKPMVCLF